MKIAACVVLYNPPTEVKENINTYLPFIEKLYVMDNSTTPISFLNDLLSMPKIEYISLNGNKGIAKALKVAAETAIKDNFDFLLTMDQDSKYPTQDFKYVKAYLEKDEIKTVGQVGINYLNKEIEQNKDKSQTEDIDWLITSGTIINLENYKKIDEFNENLFIDLVDVEISCQFLQKGFKNKVFPNILLNHKLGENRTLKFLFLKKNIVVHSPIRYYYMFRNYHYLLSHSSNPQLLTVLNQMKNRFNFAWITAHVLAEKHKLKTYKLIKRGIKDGKNALLGEFVQEKIDK